jgi:hypothetical protein
MKILFVGNFIPPLEEESLHNLTLVNQLQKEGNKCLVMNIDEMKKTTGTSQCSGVMKFDIKIVDSVNITLV